MSFGSEIVSLTPLPALHMGGPLQMLLYWIYGKRIKCHGVNSSFHTPRFPLSPTDQAVSQRP